ncbi:pyridoxamine 5'-phosphate oxidase family protein [Cellulomonas sp. JH27-2]|uniref:pyridoxamine 5'-phosphate oxidase family protein n=1 Tax=Cellulomonas sp. JH27-2 TaxID=2774139 RepID=UPI001781573E|nr:pyridoxamine 5'-phosphate oxidase family protein [Cellulomonas sp. JH27-2]
MRTLTRPPTLPDEAYALLLDWLPTNDDPERPVVTLATVDEDGAPDARSVLLSELDRKGVYVHTDASSRKVAQLAANPAVAVVARWPERQRQLVVRGVAEPAPASETDRAYARRSLYLRRLAWLNTTSVAAMPADERRAAWATFVATHQVLKPPPTWVGFLVRPTSLTFWTGDDASVSHRREHRFDGTDWTITELPG